MDFISALPKVGKLGSIVVIVACFSSYGTYTAKEVARLFIANVVKYSGIPENDVRDCDPRFTGHFWTDVFKILGSDLYFSTSFHPYTDG